jgi:hypothetical protein
VFGQPGFLPLAGHWQGGTTDGIAAYDPATSTFFIKNTAGAGTADATIVFGVGGRGFIPVAGDWIGTGKTSIGLYDPATSMWFLRGSVNPSDGSLAVTPFAFGGGSGWKPVVGDWIGQGKTTVGVVDPAANWYLRSSNSAGAPDVATPFPFGLPAWTPLGGDWGRAPLVMPLAAAGGEQTVNVAGGLLSEADLRGVADAALTQLGAAGVDPALVARLASAEYSVGVVPWGDLGLAYVGENRVVISPNAAGHGWFIDPGPVKGVAAGRMDLLTTVLHEMGHLAGLPDREGSSADLMFDTLSPGVRKTQALDAVFSGAVL